MGAVTTLAATIAAAAGVIALVKFADRQTKDLRAAIRDAKKTSKSGPVIDYECDPDSGVFKPKR